MIIIMNEETISLGFSEVVFRNEEYIHDRFLLTFLKNRSPLYSDSTTGLNIKWNGWPDGHRHQNYLQQQTDAKKGLNSIYEQTSFYLAKQGKKSKMNNSIQKKKKKVLWEEANSSLGWKKNPKWQRSMKRGKAVFRRAGKHQGCHLGTGWHGWNNRAANTRVAEAEIFHKNTKQVLSPDGIELILDYREPEQHLLAQNTPSWWLVLLLSTI